MSSNIGYLLPDGGAYTDEYECCMVFVPAKDEYRRAFFGALDYFGTWLAWERDGGHRGKDAARAWKEANELTKECWDMGACTDMVQALEDIKRLLEKQSCCGGGSTVTYVDNRVETTTIVVDSGSAPTHYGETAVADWDEWKEYVCFHAHAYVDDLVNMAEKIDGLLDLGMFAIDALSWLLGVSVFRNDGFTVPVDLTWVGVIFEAVLDAGAGYFDAIVADLEAGREDIVCALINGTSLEDAVDAAIGTTLAWDILYQSLDYESTTAVIYNGGIDGMGYLTPTKRADCVCETLETFPYQILSNPDFTGSATPWVHTAEWYWSGSLGMIPTDYDFPIDYLNLYSEEFVPQTGSARLTFRVRALGRNTHDAVYYLRIRDITDGGAIVDTVFEQFTHTSVELITIDYSYYINIIAGRTYRVELKIEADDTYTQYVKFVEVWVNSD